MFAGGVTQAPDLLQLSDDALKAHAAGDLDGAMRLYEQVLAVDPQHWLALTNRATIWLQIGRLEEGVAGLRASLAIMPGQPTALNNLGNALRMLGRPDEALHAYREAVALADGFADAWSNLAGLLHEAGRLDEAADAYGKAADAAPTVQRPRYLQGLLLNALGRKAASLEALEAAAAIPPATPELFNDLGLLRHENDRAAEAVDAFERALALRPDYVDALSNQGRALHHLDRLDEAVARLDRAVALDPGNPTALLHRGDALSARGRFEEALACYARLLELDPGHVTGWIRRGDALGFTRRIEEAMVSFNQALTLDPAHPNAPLNLAAALLREGAYEDGWRVYEHRWRDKSEVMPSLPGGLWLGEEPVAGRTLLVHSEQGLGDSLMTLRYIPLLARRGAKVLLSVQPPLERLAARVEGVAAVIPQGEPIPPFELRIPTMSLPLAFGTTYDTVPGASYLSPPPEDAERWIARLGPRSRARIGLCWAGNAKQSEDRWRSIPLEALRPLASLDADLYAVQIDIRERDRAAFEAMGLIPLGPELTDYASTAGLVEALDLVITVDTSVAHLAGAMGRSDILMLSAVPDYRWGWEGDTTPWYPTLKVFRQERIGDWSGVVEAVRAAVAARLESNGR